MDWDRYSYCRNNPTNNTDPTGHFTEEEITKQLGVKNWGQVLGLFGKGGKYEGAWGWLEVLRQAERGDSLFTGYVMSGLTDYNPIKDGDYIGDFIYGLNGKIYVQKFEGGEYIRTTLDDAMKRGSYGLIKHFLGSSITTTFTTNRYEQHNHIRIEPGKIDWVSTTLDTVAVGASLFGANTAVKGADIAQKIGIGAGASSVMKSVMVDQTPNSVILAVGGLVPGPVGGGFSLASLYFDISAGVSYTP